MKTLLIIEDDTDARQMMVFMFENNGYEVLSSSTEITVNEVTTINPNIIVIGYSKGGNAGAVSSQLKSNEATQPIPIILYSAILTVDEVPKGSADAVVAKPFELEDFVWQVSRMAL